MIDLALILLFVVCAITAGFRAKRKASRSQQEYFLAGRDTSGWKAGLSMAASQYAADTPLLATGLMATGGVFVLWRFWIYGFGYLLLGFVFAELWRRSRVLTDAEVTERRYSGPGVLARLGLGLSAAGRRARTPLAFDARREHVRRALGFTDDQLLRQAGTPTSALK